MLYDVNFTKIQGELAEIMDVSWDGKTYTFHLRKGVTFHDGQALTSADVKFSIELYKNPDSTATNASATPLSPRLIRLTPIRRS